MTKMIITDLDKTLLRNDSTVSNYTVSVLKRCQRENIKVVFATARSKQAAAPTLQRFTPNAFIGYGGGVALAGDETISRFEIPADISFRLISECLQYPEISYIHASSEMVAYTNKVNASDASTTHYKQVDFSLHKDLSYLKISLTACDPDIVQHIATGYPMLDLLRYTGEDIYRFANRNAVKWNAVTAVAEYFGIYTDMCVAFGDDKNDLEMIKNCGTGVAVQNAIDEVKAAADYICENNDVDGVAKWIQQHVLTTVST